MGLRIQQAIAEGFSLAASKNGALLVGAIFVVDLIGAVVIAAATSGAVPAAGGVWAPMDAALTPPVRMAAMSLAVVFNLVLALPVFIVAIRLFVGRVTDQLPDAFLTDRIGRATLHGLGATGVWSLLLLGPPAVFAALAAWGQTIVSGPAKTVVVGGGVSAAVLSTVFVAVAFLFTLHEISIRHRTFLGAFRGSYQTVRGQFGRVSVLFALFAGIYITLGWGAALIGNQPWTGLTIAVIVLSWLLAALAAVFTTAVLSCAYRQLRADVDGRAIVSSQPTPQSPVFSGSENKR